jgi:hypothetical protein
MLYFPDDKSKRLLPDGRFQCTFAGSTGTPCFLTGDGRANLQEALLTVHTLFMREHNRIAAEISKLNPGYDDERVFQVTRQIVMAEMQKITYQYYLPTILGEASSLIPHYSGYDRSVNPSVPNSYDAAAGRFGHSMVQPFFGRLSDGYTASDEGQLALAGSFFDTTSLRTSGVDPLARGLSYNTSQEVDQFFTGTLNHLLFTNDAQERSPGLDLISINIQRGRDHGLPPYEAWKKWAKDTCHLESDFRSEDLQKKFVRIYGNLGNVDLYAGGVSEQNLAHGIVGATFACILKETFTALRDGDRYYYENPGGGLTDDQIDEINTSVSFAQIICDNTNIHDIALDPFLHSDSRTPCADIPTIDFSPWEESSDAELNKKPETDESLSEELVRFIESDAGTKEDLSMALMEEVLREIKEG